jgi:hypothetical protein
MTVLIVKLEGQKIGQGGGIVARRQRRESEQESKKKGDSTS